MTDHHFHFDAVLPADVARERVRASLRARGAALIGTIPRAETQLAEEVWEYKDGDRIRIVDDHFVDVTWLRAQCRSAGRPADLIWGLRQELQLQEIKELMSLSKSNHIADRSHAIRGMAAIMSDYRRDVTDAIASALKDRERSLRSDALRAIARWPHFVFVKPLEQMAASEQDPELRNEALRLADDVRKHGRRGI